MVGLMIDHVTHRDSRVHVPLIDLAFDASQSVKDNVSISTDDHATSSGSSSPISSTPPAFLNYL